MPNIPSAAKRVRTSEKARRRNRAAKSTVSTLRGQLFGSFESKSLDKFRPMFREYCSVLDKAVKKGVIKKNTAIRRKRRAAAKLAALEKTG